MTVNAKLQGFEGEGLMVQGREYPDNALTSISGKFRPAESVPPGDIGRIAHMQPLIYEGPFWTVNGEMHVARLHCAVVGMGAWLKLDGLGEPIEYLDWHHDTSCVTRRPTDSM